MSCQGSNSLSSHHIENAAQQLPYTTLVEGALAFRKVSQIEGPRSVESDQSLSMAIPRVEGGSETDAKQFFVQRSEECSEPYPP